MFSDLTIFTCTKAYWIGNCSLDFCTQDKLPVQFQIVDQEVYLAQVQRVCYNHLWITESKQKPQHMHSLTLHPLPFVLLEFGTFCNPEIGMLSKPAISGLRVSSNFKSALAPWLELNFAASSQSRDCQVGQYGLQIAEEFLHSKGRCKETEQSCLAACIHSWQSGECRSVLLCYILNYQHFARTDTLCGLSFSFWMEVDRWFPFLSTTFFFWRKYWTGVCELHMGNMWPNKCLSSPLMCLWYHKVVFSTPPKYSTNLSECFRFFFLIWILAAK